MQRISHASAKACLVLCNHLRFIIHIVTTIHVVCLCIINHNGTWLSASNCELVLGQFEFSSSGGVTVFKKTHHIGLGLLELFFGHTVFSLVGLLNLQGLVHGVALSVGIGLSCRSLNVFGCDGVEQAQVLVMHDHISV